MNNETSERKLDHIKICLEEDVEARLKTTGFEDVELPHRASPETDLEEVDLSSSLFGKKLEAPIMICPMTGGHERGKEINQALAGAAQELGLAFNVGSQRAAIEDPELGNTYRVREVAPDVLLSGNLGAVQLSRDYGVEEVEEAIEMIDADALAIHFNSLQEAIQSGGDTDFGGVLEKFSEVASEVGEPLYIKETGAGVDSRTARDFASAGARAVDVSGAGGTSWAGVEALRSEDGLEPGEIFWDWGIPTSISTAEVADSVDVPVISSGGIRTGLEAAKAIALGADLVGVGLPLFRASVRGREKVVEWLEEFIRELRTAMFLTGCGKVGELQEVPMTVSNPTLDQLFQRGVDIRREAGRGEGD